MVKPVTGGSRLGSRGDCDGGTGWSGNQVEKWFRLTWTRFAHKWHFLRFGARALIWTVAIVSYRTKCRRGLCEFLFFPSKNYLFLFIFSHKCFIIWSFL